MDFVFVQERVSTSTKQRRQTHSHSARVAKVKGARKLQVVDRTRQTGSAEDNSDKEINPQPTSRARQHTQAVVSRGETAVPAPRSLSGAFEYKPLATFLSSLTPREHFLFDYYVRVVIPHMSAKIPVSQQSSEYHDRMRKNWVLFSSTNTDLLRGFLLAGCRHLSLVHCDEKYAEIATRLKVTYIQGLRKMISPDNPSIARAAAARALILAFDDLMLGDDSTATKHIEAALQIVEMAGGFQAVDPTSVVYYMFSSSMNCKKLEFTSDVSSEAVESEPA